MEDGLVIKVLLGDDRLDDVLHEIGMDLVVGDVWGVLGGDQDGVHADGGQHIALLLVLHGDLGLAIRPQPRHLPVLAHLSPHNQRRLISPWLTLPHARIAQHGTTFFRASSCHVQQRDDERCDTCSKDASAKDQHRVPQTFINALAAAGSRKPLPPCPSEVVSYPRSITIISSLCQQKRAHLCKAVAELGGEHVGEGHELWGLVCGIAKHVPLVPSTNLLQGFGAQSVHSLANVW